MSTLINLNDITNELLGTPPNPDNTIDPNIKTVNNTIKQFSNSISTGYASDVDGTKRKGNFF